MEIFATLHCTMNSTALGYRKIATVALEITTQKITMATSQTLSSKFIRTFYSFIILNIYFLSEGQSYINTERF